MNLSVKSNLVMKISFGKVNLVLDLEIRKMLMRSLYGNENSTFVSGL